MKTLVSVIALLAGSNIAALTLAPTAFAKDWKSVAIGMDDSYVPWHFADSSGKMVGFDVDLAMDLCQRAGFECKIVIQDWDGLIPGLNAGKFDAIIAGMAITADRKKAIDFSKPYAAPPMVFIAAKDGPVAQALGPAKVVVNAAKDPAAGDAAIKAVQTAMKGRTIGVQSASIQGKFANAYLKDVATIKEYKSQDDRDHDLESGGIDLVLDNAPAIAVVLDKPEAKNLESVGPALTGLDVFGGSRGGAGIGLRKSDADLGAAFNKALDAAFADGSVQKYSVKWFKVDTTPTQ
jgi:octopine/nopaline transport system substrate-binding protein